MKLGWIAEAGGHRLLHHVQLVRPERRVRAVVDPDLDQVVAVDAALLAGLAEAAFLERIPERGAVALVRRGEIVAAVAGRVAPLEMHLFHRPRARALLLLLR
jgi:hypothetical protein